MYRQNRWLKTSLNTKNTYEGETIEQKINRIVNNKEPITDGAPLIYTERKKGVEAQYDIRTDRFEIAVEMMDKVHKDRVAKREAFHKELDEKNNPKKDKTDESKTGNDNKNEGGTQPVPNT